MPVFFAARKFVVLAFVVPAFHLFVDSVTAEAQDSPNVLVEGTDGKTVTGVLVQWNPQSIRLADERTFSIDELASIEFPDVERRDSTEISVALTNDSLIAANAANFDGKAVTVDLRRQPDFEASADQVVAIRFRAPTATTDKAWLGLLSQDAAADRMVIRRDGERLDSIEGAIESINDETVEFSIDGDTVKAPISKLEGVIFRGNGEATDSQNSSIVVDDAYGGRWRVGAMELDGSDFALESGTLRHRIPTDQVRTIRFGGSRVSLAQAERASSRWNTPFGTKLPRSATDAFFLSAISDTGDLELPAGSKIDFRVPEGMSRLAGSVGRPPEISLGGQVEVVIRDGDEVLWQSILDGNQRQGFDLDIAECRRIEIEVTDGNDGNLGDVIRFTSARFVR